jgi:cytochrome c556
MRQATSPLKLSTSAIAVAIFLGAAGAALAQAKPDTENGRYALSPIADGVLRLDTRTGAVSTCSNSGAGWACYAVPDERSAFDAEIGRLQADNERLKAQLAERDGTVTGKVEEALPKSDPLKKPEPKVAEGERKIEIPLPSDRDMDRMMAFLEKAWRRLIEMANRVQKDVAGKI